MDATHFFDAIGYFRNLCERNILARDSGFHFCTCSGIETLQGPLQNYRTKSAFFCVDDTNDTTISRTSSGGHYAKRVFTVFLMRRYRIDDMEDRARQLEICRDLFSQILSKLLVDEDDLRNELVYLDTRNVMSREFGQYFLSGCTGLYFMVEVSEPVDLSYNDEQWAE